MSMAPAMVSDDFSGSGAAEHNSAGFGRGTASAAAGAATNAATASTAAARMRRNTRGLHSWAMGCGG